MILGTELRCFLLFPEELQLSKAPHPAPKGKGFGGGTKRTQKAGEFGRWDERVAGEKMGWSWTMDGYGWVCFIPDYVFFVCKYGLRFSQW
jgi:hypothetical protein